MCVRSSDSDTLLFADYKGLQELHLRSLQVLLLCGHETDPKTGCEWCVVNVTEVNDRGDSLLLLEYKCI